MDKFARVALLADFYGPLLTEKQRNVLDLYYQQDFSLAEIADLSKISRQGIHDLLKRTEQNLAQYEDKLGLVQRFWAERDKLAEGRDLAQNLSEQDFANRSAWEHYRRLQEIIDDVYAGLFG